MRVFFSGVDHDIIGDLDLQLPAPHETKSARYQAADFLYALTCSWRFDHGPFITAVLHTVDGPFVLGEVAYIRSSTAPDGKTVICRYELVNHHNQVIGTVDSARLCRFVHNTANPGHYRLEFQL